MQKTLPRDSVRVSYRPDKGLGAHRGGSERSLGGAQRTRNHKYGARCPAGVVRVKYWGHSKNNYPAWFALQVL